MKDFQELEGVKGVSGSEEPKELKPIVPTESEHLIALSNSKPAPGRGRVYTRSLEEYDRLVRQPWLKRLVEEIRQGDESKKTKLPFRAAHYYAFKDNHRAQKDIIKESFTHQTVVDVDDPDYVERAIRRAKELNHQEGLWKGMLMHMEYSARRKLHIDIRIPRGMTIEEAQQEYCRLLDVPFDKSCTSPERFIYLTPIEDEIYRSEEWYKVVKSEGLFSSEEFSLSGVKGVKGVIGSDEPGSYRKQSLLANTSDYDNSMQAGHSALTPKPEGLITPLTPLTPQEKSASSACHLEYHGLPATEIVAKYWELNNDGQPPTQGDRNTKIFDLACSLRHIFGFDRELLNRAIPNYEGFPQEEKMQCIDNAIREPRKYMPMKLTRVLQALKAEQSNLPSIEGGDGGGSAGFACPPPMPKKLPPLIAHLVKNVPAHAREATAHAVFPALGAHLGGVKFRYIDNVEHEATFMCVLLAKMSSGKGAVNTPIEYILADIKERDAYNRLREQEWKDAVSTKGANKEKPKRPEGLTVQVLSPDMTNAAFVQRLKDAEGKFLYSRMDEIELLDNLKTSGRGNQVSQIIRLAFDQGEYGQERVGAGSVTALARVKWNWNASSTIQKGRWYFRNALTDGTLSRLNICTIKPLRGADIPVYGTYDEDFAKALKPYIDRLNEARGLVKCVKAEQLARKLMAENAERVALSDDEAYEVLSYRANVIAYLKAMTLYVAHGKWLKEFDAFVRWSEEYDLWCKMHFFGDALHEAMNQEEIVVRRGPRNMLALLPETFTKEEVVQLRRARGMTGEADAMLKAWLHRGYIVRTNEDSIFTKTKQGGSV